MYIMTVEWGKHTLNTTTIQEYMYSIHSTWIP